MASNDNHDPEFGLVESVVDGVPQWAIAEYDKLGPILRLGPFDDHEWARQRLAAYREMRALEFEDKERRK